MKRPIAVLFIVLFYVIQVQAQYRIETQIKPLSDSDIYLGYHFGDEKFVIDTCHLDKSGKGVFSGKKSLNEGVYMIVLPNMTYFDILVAGDQIFSVYNDTSDLNINLSVTGNKQNEIYVNYQKFTSIKRREIARYSERLSYSKDSAGYYNTVIEKERMDIIHERNKIIKDYPGTFFSSLLKAMSDPEIPSLYENVKDPLSYEKRMNYLSNHYFDNYDFTDERLLYSPVLNSKVITYFGDIVVADPDSVNIAIDKLLMKSMQNLSVYRYLADLLMNLFDLSGDLSNDEAFVYLSENYYLNGLAPWANQLFLAKLKNHIDELSPTLIGNSAPELKLINSEGKETSIYGIHSCYTIAVFWNPDCDHCKDFIYDLKQLKKNYNDDMLQIMAVLAGENDELWKDFIEKNQLNWINVYDPSKKNEFIKTYKLYMTPRVFILDKTKHIVLKDVSTDIIKNYLDGEKDNSCK